ncbi:MAG: 3-phosphoshikimate 1-carboxyvinyltransferase [Oscillospiraceae bacterium]|nr:3-phosphoshikimate 1-carboxyvinyltransferase [Oscillospiraceae bacterium]
MDGAGRCAVNRQIRPGTRNGSVRIPASKSQAHRLLIVAALGEGDCQIRCDGISRDIAATIDCLNGLGAEIRSETDCLIVHPIRQAPQGVCLLPCGESGSTLRFLLPVAGVLEAEAMFLMEGRLPQRPLAPLDQELTRQGMTLQREENRLFCRGVLRPGAFRLPGNVSSQYVSGLLLALPLLNGDSTLAVEGPVESSAYIAMTEQALALAGIAYEKQGWTYRLPGNQKGCLPQSLRVEGDYSNAAFFLCIGALSPEGVCVAGLSPDSVQGDRAVVDILRRFGAEVCETESGILTRRGTLRGVVIDAAPIPDLIPVLSVVAAAAEGETRIVNAGRLRLKESDRLRSTTALLSALGADIVEGEDSLTIHGRSALKGGTVDSFGDHRIAMAAAAAATVCERPVTVIDPDCVQKSYPRFWEDFDRLTGGEA